MKNSSVQKQTKLVEIEEFVEASRLKYLGGRFTANFVFRMLRLDKINEIYGRYCQAGGQEFLDSVLNELQIEFEFDETELNRIPHNGSFITISNHPYGGIDGIFLLKYIASLRPDYKTLSTFLIKRLKPLSNYMFAVNPFENSNGNHSFAGIKMALNHLKNGHPLGIFPAGEVSSYNRDFPGISDKTWSPSVIKLIKISQVPVLPVYFDGSNSAIFHFLGRIHPILRTAKIPSEILNKKNRTIRVRVGNLISVNKQQQFPELEKYGDFLRAHTYALGMVLKTSQSYNKVFSKPLFKNIATPVPHFKILNELDKLREDGCCLFGHHNYEVFFVSGSKLTNIILELGSLREITFREAGEGINKPIDTDGYDQYYYQLFLWDKNNQKIAGAYRLGKGADIIEKSGIEGMYIQSLFHIHTKFLPILKKSIELGRSFIVKEYQKKSLPLFLLWKGIYYFMKKNPEYRYLTGTVSVSNTYSDFSKNMIIHFLKKYHFDKSMAQYIKARTKFKYTPQGLLEDILFENATTLNALSEILKSIDPLHEPVPVLIRKYLMLNGKFIGFNVDPKFNFSLDCLIVVDFEKIPPLFLHTLSKECTVLSSEKPEIS